MRSFFVACVPAFEKGTVGRRREQPAGWCRACCSAGCRGGAKRRLRMEVVCLRLKGGPAIGRGRLGYLRCLRFVVVGMRQRRRACDMGLSGCDGVVALACGLEMRSAVVAANSEQSMKNEGPTRLSVPRFWFGLRLRRLRSCQLMLRRSGSRLGDAASMSIWSFTIWMAAAAASSPLLPRRPPQRSSACCMSLTVSTPKAMGMFH